MISVSCEKGLGRRLAWTHPAPLLASRESSLSPMTEQVFFTTLLGLQASLLSLLPSNHETVKLHW